MNKALVKGSVAQVAADSGKKVEEVIMEAEILVLIDQSGSMNARDGRGHSSRYDVADEELAKIQRDHPGKIVVVSFSDDVQVNLDGRPTRFGGGTDMEKALTYVYEAGVDGLLTIVLVSDGEPDDSYTGGADTMAAAARFSSPIHTIFVGPDGGEGAAFMRRLAKATGGKPYVSVKPGELGAGVIALLEDKNGGQE